VLINLDMFYLMFIFLCSFRLVNKVDQKDTNVDQTSRHTYCHHVLYINAVLILVLIPIDLKHTAANATNPVSG